MTVGTTLNEITVDGNGVTTTFAYPFLIPAASDVVVIYTDAAGAPTTLSSTQFTITGIGTATGGIVAYPLSGSPIADGTTITIRRSLPIVQTTSLSNQGPTFSSIESALDYLTMVCQQINSAGILAIQAPPTDPAGLNYTLPVASVRAGQTVGFDSAGNVIVGSEATALVSAAMQPVVAAATVGDAFDLIAASGGTVGGALTASGIATSGAGSIGSALSVGFSITAGATIRALSGGFVFPDGSLQTTAAAGGSSGATPSTKINGLVVAGTASTFMRSDAVPGLASTGVTAGVYGSATQIAQVTFDGYGRATAAANVAFTGPTTLLAVGTYLLAQYHVAATAVAGTTYAGSTLYNLVTESSYGASGTWRCMGPAGVYTPPLGCNPAIYGYGLFLRIA